MTDHEKQQLEKISKLCENFSDCKVDELDGLAYGFDYMTEARRKMVAAFQRYNSLKRPKEKEKAWERVTDQVFRIKTMSDSAIFCIKKMD
jgi:hypothetical protein